MVASNISLVLKVEVIDVAIFVHQVVFVLSILGQSVIVLLVFSLDLYLLVLLTLVDDDAVVVLLEVVAHLGGLLSLHSLHDI